MNKALLLFLFLFGAAAAEACQTVFSPCELGADFSALTSTASRPVFVLRERVDAPDWDAAVAAFADVVSDVKSDKYWLRMDYRTSGFEVLSDSSVRMSDKDFDVEVSGVVSGIAFDPANSCSKFSFVSSGEGVPSVSASSAVRLVRDGDLIFVYVEVFECGATVAGEEVEAADFCDGALSLHALHDVGVLGCMIGEVARGGDVANCQNGN